MADRGAAIRVIVTRFVLALAEGITEFVDHAAVTPAGKPETEKLTAPAKEPPVAAVNARTAEPP